MDPHGVLFLDRTGPLIYYQNGILYIHDLNPEVKTQWQMSRWEMFRTGLNFLLAALKG